jgi:hypothetical protein
MQGAVYGAVALVLAAVWFERLGGKAVVADYRVPYPRVSACLLVCHGLRACRVFKILETPLLSANRTRTADGRVWLSMVGCTLVTAEYSWLYACGCTHVAVRMWLYACGMVSERVMVVRMCACVYMFACTCGC